MGCFWVRQRGQREHRSSGAGDHPSHPPQTQGHLGRRGTRPGWQLCVDPRRPAELGAQHHQCLPEQPLGLMVPPVVVVDPRRPPELGTPAPPASGPAALWPGGPRSAHSALLRIAYSRGVPSKSSLWVEKGDHRLVHEGRLQWGPFEVVAGCPSRSRCLHYGAADPNPQPSTGCRRKLACRCR